MKNLDLTKTTRRKFLEYLAMGAGAVGMGLGFPGALTAQDRIHSTTIAPKSVLVLGAGLAGLAAALELEKAGHQVTVLEARNRVGGRVSTVKEPFAEGLFVEEGAVGFSEAYTTALQYIEELGLVKIPFPMPQLPVVHYLKGKRFVVTPGEPVGWPYELTAEEAELGPWGLVSKYILGTLPSEISTAENWSKAPLLDLDDLSLSEYMRSMGASEGAIELVQNTQYFAGVPEETSALSVAVSDMGLFMGGAPFILEGGNDSLPRAMAEKLQGPIHLEVEVSKISERDGKVHVKGKQGREAATFTADHVICTFPASVLNKIKIEPALAAEVQVALNELPYLDLTRTFLQVDRPFWLQENISGAAFTDLQLGVIYEYTHQGEAKDHSAILESYVSGPRAKELGQLPEKQLIRQTLEQMEKIHPQVEEHFQKGYVKAWSDDPYAHGGVSWPAPGDVGKYLKTLQRSHGKIHFAGEHTSILRSSMEGALRSGIRAAKVVHELS